MTLAEMTVRMPEEMMRKVEDLARQQNRPASDVMLDAARKYLDEQSWLQFVERNELRARAMGITEDDVNRLIAETCGESKQHNR